MIGHAPGRRRRLAAVAGLAAASIGVAGCGFKGAYSLPLPGGASHGRQVIVHAIFSDVQDLVPDAAVRVNDVPVGTVTDITLTRSTPQRADVTLSLNAPVAANLPHNAVATLSQTSLLGEKYVSLEPPPAQAAQGRLTAGEVLRDGSTSTLPDVEEVFGALSLVLNNGDLQDLQTIDIEVSKALNGREQAIKESLHQITRFVSDLDGQRHAINAALDQLNRLSGELSHQTGTITTALTDISPGLKVLADENGQFTRLLTDLSRFGRVASHVINNSRQATVADLRDLQPVLRHLAAAGSNVPHALEILVTYPFPHNIGADAPGDYTGLDLSFDAGQGQLLTPLCSLLSIVNALRLDQACPQESKNAPPVHGPAAAHRGGGNGAGSITKKLPKLKLPKLPVPTISPSLPSVPVPTPSLLPGGINPLAPAHHHHKHHKHRHHKHKHKHKSGLPVHLPGVG